MIKILDCTLRDGGYNNNWEFGENNILKIYKGLVESKIDIIECGFYTQKGEPTSDQSIFTSLDGISEYLNTSANDCLSVCMINYGDYEIDDIPIRKETYIDGIRVAFHKSDRFEALEYCDKLIKKGYKVFIQPMVSMSYTDIEFLDLIDKSNAIKPFAFYIVDSFGVMKENDLLRFFYLIDNNLSKGISIGFHSHNNFQLSFSHAQTLVNMGSQREIIIDSSIMGMGRGAGNLNSELFVQFLNERRNTQYKIEPLLTIVDDILTPIYHNNYWGYSLPQYLSAKYNCHPNYASYLDDKNTLVIRDINNILQHIEEDRKVNYSKDYIEKLYLKYQSQISTQSSYNELKDNLIGKDVLIIAPGNSILDESKEINGFISEQDNLVIISVNFIPKYIKSDYLFVSNIKRFEQLSDVEDIKLIQTSNIPALYDSSYIVNYSDLINDDEVVFDNAGLMFIKLLINIGANSISLAGFDGYSYGTYDNYSQKELSIIQSDNAIQAKNIGFSEVISNFSTQIPIKFITQEKYVKIKQ